MEILIKRLCEIRDDVKEFEPLNDDDLFDKNELLSNIGRAILWTFSAKNKFADWLDGWVVAKGSSFLKDSEREAITACHDAIERQSKSCKVVNYEKAFSRICRDGVLQSNPSED